MFSSLLPAAVTQALGPVGTPLSVVGVAVLLLLLLVRMRGSKKSRVAAPGATALNSHVKNAQARVSRYTELHAEGGGTEDDRKENCQEMVNQYYDMATDFYEYGWGQNFHFAPRNTDETHRESLARHEYYLSSQLGLKSTDRVLDLGCGVGGPMRNISRFSGATIIGLNNNAYQVMRGNAKNKAMVLQDKCRLIKGDFMNPPFEDGEFDHAYAIEATCHAPDRTECFKQVYRMLKPGGTFAVYEWVHTDKFDKDNAEHVRLKEGIEIGNGLPYVSDAQAVVDAFTNAGFQDVTSRDLAEHPGRPNITWHHLLGGEFSLEGFRCTRLGIAVTTVMVRVLEFFCLAPKGTSKMHDHLVTGARTLRRAGELGIFTPMLYVKGRKPLNA